MNASFIRDTYEKFEQCSDDDKLSSIFYVLIKNYYSLEQIKADLEFIKSNIDNIKIQQRIDHISDKLNSLNV